MSSKNHGKNESSSLYLNSDEFTQAFEFLVQVVEQAYPALLHEVGERIQYRADEMAAVGQTERELPSTVRHVMFLRAALKAYRPHLPKKSFERLVQIQRTGGEFLTMVPFKKSTLEELRFLSWSLAERIVSWIHETVVSPNWAGPSDFVTCVYHTWSKDITFDNAFISFMGTPPRDLNTNLQLSDKPIVALAFSRFLRAAFGYLLDILALDEENQTTSNIDVGIRKALQYLGLPVPEYTFFPDEYKKVVLLLTGKTEFSKLDHLLLIVVPLIEKVYIKLNTEDIRDDSMEDALGGPSFTSPTACGQQSCGGAVAGT